MSVKEPPDILKKIVSSKVLEVEHFKKAVPLEDLCTMIDQRTGALNLAGALWGDSVRVIAEVKKASPTKGLLAEKFDPKILATEYAKNGAAAVSVLTESDYFQGSLLHMEAVRSVVNAHGLPVLRKEFIFDPYQVYESRAYGADAILLIVAILSPEQLKKLMQLADELWMQCLVEVHDESELEIALGAGSEIIGINNRNLKTFNTDLGITERLAPSIPNGRIIVSESGINSRDHIIRVGQAGANAVLVGESLITADDPGAKLRQLV